MVPLLGRLRRFGKVAFGRLEMMRPKEQAFVPINRWIMHFRPYLRQAFLPAKPASVQRITLALLDKPGNRIEVDALLVNAHVLIEAIAMNIRRATAGDGSALVDIWLRSVRATHEN